MYSAISKLFRVSFCWVHVSLDPLEAGLELPVDVSVGSILRMFCCMLIVADLMKNKKHLTQRIIVYRFCELRAKYGSFMILVNRRTYFRFSYNPWRIFWIVICIDSLLFLPCPFILVCDMLTNSFYWPSTTCHLLVILVHSFSCTSQQRCKYSWVWQIFSGNSRNP